MKLSTYAKKLGLNYHTVYRAFHRGEIKGAYALPTGTIIIPDEVENVKRKDEKVAIYARVSSSENKSNLDAQAKRLCDYCCARGYKIDRVIKEIGSGVNDKRPKLSKLLDDRSIARIVVEHKDRLTRFGFNYLAVALNGRCEIEVVNEESDAESDIVQDFVSIITSFCARIYGFRRSKRKTEQLIRELEHD